MKRHCLFLVATIAWISAPMVLPAQDSSKSEDLLKVPPELVSVLANINPQHGKVEIDEHAITLDLPDDLGYLTPDEANTLMRSTMHFPRMKILGAIVPTTVPLGSRASWAAVITHLQGGHVDDSGGANLNPGLLLSRLVAENDQHKAKLKEMGFSKVGLDILGWATQPHYESSQHALIWAIETRPVDGKDYAVHYHINILGRQGVIVLLAICSLEQLPMIEADVAKISSLAQFTPSNHYADFTPGTDKKAPYGLADLIVGNIAAAHLGHKEAAEAAGAVGPNNIAIPLFALLVISALLWKRLRRKSQ